MRVLNLKSIIAALTLSNTNAKSAKPRTTVLNFKTQVTAGHGPTCGRDC